MGRQRVGLRDEKKEGCAGEWGEGGRTRGFGRRRAVQWDGKKEGMVWGGRKEGGVGG